MVISSRGGRDAMNMPGIVRALLVMAATLVLAAPEDAKADAARGQGLTEQWCSQCHWCSPLIAVRAGRLADRNVDGSRPRAAQCRGPTGGACNSMIARLIRR